MRRRWWIGSMAAAYVVAAVACGARSELPVPKARPVQMGEGGGPPECVVFNSSTELAPLDVFVMLDASGSMAQPTGDNQAKWTSVRNALEAFVYDPQSRGIGVALTFFPIIVETLPELCQSDTVCNGVVDACRPHKVCPTTGIFCLFDSDCDAQGFGDTCEQIGQCSMQVAQQCIPGFNPCPAGQGTCQPIGFCENRFTCESASYEEPIVEVGQLPDAAAGLLSAIDNKAPEGATPTLPALAGAVDHAIQHKAEFPDRNVILVFATDGVPTVCDDALFTEMPGQALDNLANAAAAGAANGIQTFVIGVFAPEEEESAEAGLKAIAEAGGTGEPFVVNTAGSVASEFREALNQVRVSAKSCQFDLIEGDEPTDYSGVWVRVSRNGEEVWVKRVDNLADCDPISGGFYYDQPLGGPTDPSTVLLCPATCGLLGSSPDRTVEIFTTCGPDA